MNRTKKALAAGAAGMVLAAGGAFPAAAAAAPKTRADGVSEPAVGSVFSGTIEIASTDGLLVERKQRKGASALIAVDTDRETVVSKGGLTKSIEDLSQGAEVIVSGTKHADGAVLASKIIIRA